MIKKRCSFCKGKLSDEEIAKRMPLHTGCIDAYADAQADKAARKQAKIQRAAQKAERAEIKQKKEKLVSYNEQKKLTQAAINKWVVHVRDANEPCISCGTMNARWNCGHYRSRGSSPHLALDLRNLHKQCVRCNMDLHGNLIEYRKALVKKYGAEWVEALESDQEPRRYKAQELIEMRAKFAKAFREKSFDI